MDTNHKTIKNKRHKTTKTEIITIRVTQDEKKLLEKKAAKNNMSLSGYLVSPGLNSGPKDRTSPLANIHSAVLLQQVCNYIEDTYGRDKILEEWSTGLWENLL